MSEVIGRKKECAQLKELLESKESEFLAVYGRRRTGKTYLIKRQYERELTFHCTGVQKKGMAVQLQAFTNELSVRRKQIIARPRDWLEAFLLLRDYLSGLPAGRKKVVFLDELPWLHTQRSGCLQALAHFWNNWAAWEENIILIICGSSTSWIIQKVLNDKGGLHNRVTKRIRLHPFTLKETETYFKSKNIALARYQIVTLYMVTGGIPFYLNEVKRGESAAQVIQRTCFEDGGLLKDEFPNLYAALFKNARNYITVVKALADHHYGLTRSAIIKKTKLPNAGSTSRVLNDLVEGGFIIYMTPPGDVVSGGKYILLDFYSRFNLKFMRGQKSWVNILDTPQWRAWSGIAFEIVCLMHIEQIKQALGISGISTSQHILHLSEGKKTVAQIDLLIDRADLGVNLCEMKFSGDVYSLGKVDARKIQNRMRALKQHLPRRKTIYPTMITTFGCHKNSHYLGLITNELTIDDLFI